MADVTDEMGLACSRIVGPCETTEVHIFRTIVEGYADSGATVGWTHVAEAIQARLTDFRHAIVGKVGSLPEEVV